ncbi:MAG TPA: chemotaxis protein CheX [Terracidiphilus sp.]|jgi:chemotaxis protein CheX|nr:chemotaxis protein CheX [Terracidiphilus sp.]
MQLNGVRVDDSGQGIGQGVEGVERAMKSSLRESMHLVSDPSHLDASVDEVFRLMLGIHCAQHERNSEVPEEKESVTAVVGFGGQLSGACVFRCGALVAMKIAGHMTGMEFHEVDDTVKDGIGELCNMLAGAWKGKVPALAANCGLSVPAVITGRDYNLHVQSPEFQIHHTYHFDQVSFDVTIVCDSLQ